MTKLEFILYIAGWNGKGLYATVKVNNSNNVFYISRNKPQYIPFYLEGNLKLNFILFQ